MYIEPTDGILRQQKQKKTPMLCLIKHTVGGVLLEYMTLWAIL